MSSPLPITRSIVQGSGLGPALYITYKSDLHSVSSQNFIRKFADDTTLGTPQNSDVSITIEFQHLLNWATENGIEVNTLKTKEVVFCRPRVSNSLIPPPIFDIEQVPNFKLLGIFLSQHLSMDQHVNTILSIINQRFFLLNQLRKNGLPTPALNCVFHALIMSRILYALPAFSGFLSASNIARLDAALSKARRWGITDLQISIQDLIEQTDEELFYKIHLSNHCLNHLLPPISPASQTYDLRPRGHPFTLPESGTLFKKSFVTRCLYKYK